MNKKGMSLVEVLLAGALMAGLGLVVARISEQSRKVTKTTETNAEILAVAQDIAFILSDKNSCKETLQGTVGSSLSSIKKVTESGIQDIYTVNSLLGNDTFKIDNVTTELSAGGVNLLVDFERANKDSLGGKKLRRRIPLKAVLSSDNSEIINCFSDIESVVETAVKASCRGNAARYDEGAIECHHDLAVVICEPGKVMQQIITEEGTIKSECTPIIPTAMNCGPGEFIKSITNDGTTTCEPLDTKNPSCQPGQYAVSLINGEISCRSIPKCGGGAKSFLTSDPTTGELMCLGLSCDPSNQYFAGFSNSGAAVCKNFPDKSCGQGQYIKEVKPDGTIECAEVPNHVSLAKVDYSFVDGFDQATNTWSRKSLLEVAQKMCESFVGTSWNGNNCDVNLPIPPTHQDICETIDGASWDGSHCKLQEPEKISSEDICSVFEGATWNGSKCELQKTKSFSNCHWQNGGGNFTNSMKQSGSTLGRMAYKCHNSKFVLSIDQSLGVGVNIISGDVPIVSCTSVYYEGGGNYCEGASCNVVNEKFGGTPGMKNGVVCQGKVGTGTSFTMLCCDYE